MSNTTIRAALIANTVQTLGCTADQAGEIVALFPGCFPERIALDREAGRGWLYFAGERCPATLGTCPRSAALLASLLAR